MHIFAPNGYYLCGRCWTYLLFASWHQSRGIVERFNLLRCFWLKRGDKLDKRFVGSTVRASLVLRWWVESKVPAYKGYKAGNHISLWCAATPQCTCRFGTRRNPPYGARRTTLCHPHFSVKIRQYGRCRLQETQSRPTTQQQQSSCP